MTADVVLVDRRTAARGHRRSLLRGRRERRRRACCPSPARCALGRHRGGGDLGRRARRCSSTARSRPARSVSTFPAGVPVVGLEQRRRRRDPGDARGGRARDRRDRKRRGREPRGRAGRSLRSRREGSSSTARSSPISLRRASPCRRPSRVAATTAMSGSGRSAGRARRPPSPPASLPFSRRVVRRSARARCTGSSSDPRSAPISTRPRRGPASSISARPSSRSCSPSRRCCRSARLQARSERSAYVRITNVSTRRLSVSVGSAGDRAEGRRDHRRPAASSHPAGPVARPSSFVPTPRDLSSEAGAATGRARSPRRRLARGARAVDSRRPAARRPRLEARAGDDRDARVRRDARGALVRRGLRDRVARPTGARGRAPRGRAVARRNANRAARASSRAAARPLHVRAHRARPDGRASRARSLHDPRSSHTRATGRDDRPTRSSIASASRSYTRRPSSRAREAHLDVNRRGGVPSPREPLRAGEGAAAPSRRDLRSRSEPDSRPLAVQEVRRGLDPGVDGRRVDRGVPGLPRDPQHRARPVEGRHPLPPGRHARRGQVARRCG